MTDRILSIFIDESGDFGSYDPRSPYYIVSMVFHDQLVDITDELSSFSTHLAYHGYHRHALHTGPLIRREADYDLIPLKDRKKLFNSLFHLARKLPVHYACIKVNKQHIASGIELTACISRALVETVRSNSSLLDSYDRIIVYYDNGQSELTKIIVSVFSMLVPEVVFRKVLPVDYRLFQIADLVCTMELLADKADHRCLSKSELAFFGSARSFKKNYLKWIRRKML